MKVEMTKSDLNKYTAMLEARQAALVQGMRNRDGIVIEKSPDAFDDIQYKTERELAIRNLARESSLLRNVRQALRRIEEGNFGVCLGCEEDISSKRLSAVPWATLCIGCQEIADGGTAGDAGDPDERLGSAA